MRAKRPTALVREAGYLLLGLVSLATVTGLYFLLDVPLVAAAFTYLVVLVLLSLVSNLSSLIVLSFIGVCCLSYFFAPPIYSFRVDYAQDLITISAFVITSFVVNFLVTRVRDANQRLEVTNKALRIEKVERKRAEQAQRESEDKLRQIIERGLGSEGKKAEVQPGFKAQVQAILNVIPAHTWRTTLVFRKIILCVSASTLAHSGTPIFPSCIRTTAQKHKEIGRPVCARVRAVRGVFEFVTLKEAIAGSSVAPNRSGRAMEPYCSGSE